MLRKPIYLIYIVLFFLLFQAGPSFAQDTKAYEQKKARLEREIAIIDK